MRFFLSGPMTGIPEHNFPAFHEAAAVLRERGYEVMSPAELAEFVGPHAPRSLYMREDLKALLECDAMAMLPGWQDSRGSRLEHEIAEQLDMLIVDYQG